MSENTPITQKPIKGAYWDKKHKIRGLHKDVRVYRSPKRKLKETPEQINYISWLRFNHPELAERCFHAINETSGGANYQAQLNKMGRNKGIPDLHFLCLPFVIEMKKTIGGSVSSEQKEHLNTAAESGWLSCVCFGAEAAKLATIDFIKERDMTFL